MNAGLSRIALALVALAVTSPAWALDTSYPVRYLDPTDAMVALSVHLPGFPFPHDCAIKSVYAKDTTAAGFKGVLDVHCENADLLPKIQTALSEIDVPPPTRRFHIAVLGASRKEGPTPELPASEAKALNDFKKVMTYRSFTIEGETVLQSDMGAHAQLNANYEVELVMDPKKVNGDAIEVRRFQLRGINPQVSPSGSQSMPNYIETSFSIHVGETLVLGASASDQQARVVLVTALP